MKTKAQIHKPFVINGAPPPMMPKLSADDQKKRDKLIQEFLKTHEVKKCPPGFAYFS